MPRESRVRRHVSETPDTLALLRGAHAAVTQRLGGRLDAVGAQATLRQLDLVLRELIHRHDGLDKVLHQQLREGERIRDALRTLVSARRPRAAAGTRTASPKRLSELAAEISALLGRLGTKAGREPRAAASLSRITRRIVAWENTLLAAQSAPVCAAAAPSKRRHAPEVPDAEALGRWLRQQPGLPDDLAAPQLLRLSGGFSRATWAIETQSRAWGSRPLVLRQQLGGGLLEGLFATLRQEHPLLKTVSAAGLPVPMPLALCRAPNPLGGDVIVMDKVPGQTLGLPTGHSTLVSEPILKDLAEALARLHRIDWRVERQALKGSVTWNRDPTLSLRTSVEQLVEHWATFCAAQIEIASPALDAGFAWLRAHIPARDGIPRIVHGDVGFHNLLVHDNRLSAWLDWETAHFGDPVKDLAHVKPTIEQHMSWPRFMQWYLDAGGDEADAEAFRYYEVLKAVTHVAVGYLARGSRFTATPGERFELTEIGCGHLPYFMQSLNTALTQT